MWMWTSEGLGSAKARAGTSKPKSAKSLILQAKNVTEILICDLIMELEGCNSMIAVA